MKLRITATSAIPLLPFLLGQLLLGAGCSNPGSYTVSDNSAYVAETIVGSINAALNENERTSSIASASSANVRSAARTKSNAQAVRSLAANASCAASRFSPALGGTSCTGTVGGDTVTATYSCNTGENLDLSLRGTAILTFDSPTTCGAWLEAIPTQGNMTWTSTDFTRITTDEAVIITNSSDTTNYKKVTIGGGIKTAFGSTSSLNILGLRVTREIGSNQVIYDHTIRSNTPFSVTGTQAAGSREVISGSVTVDHNVDQYSAYGVISDLKWNTTCCVPASGTINFTFSGTRVGAMTMDFNTGTCGSITVSDATQPASAGPTPGASPSPVTSTQTIGGCQ
jgi:hypothetical protein